MCIFTFQLEVFIQEVKVNSFGSKFSFHVRCVVFWTIIVIDLDVRVPLVNSQELQQSVIIPIILIILMCDSRVIL